MGPRRKKEDPLEESSIRYSQEAQEPVKREGKSDMQATGRRPLTRQQRRIEDDAVKAAKVSKGDHPPENGTLEKGWRVEETTTGVLSAGPSLAEPENREGAFKEAAKASTSNDGPQKELAAPGQRGKIEVAIKDFTTLAQCTDQPDYASIAREALVSSNHDENSSVEPENKEPTGSLECVSSRDQVTRGHRFTSKISRSEEFEFQGQATKSDVDFSHLGSALSDLTLSPLSNDEKRASNGFKVPGQDASGLYDNVQSHHQLISSEAFTLPVAILKSRVLKDKEPTSLNSITADLTAIATRSAEDRRQSNPSKDSLYEYDSVKISTTSSKRKLHNSPMKTLDMPAQEASDPLIATQSTLDTLPPFNAKTHTESADFVQFPRTPAESSLMKMQKGRNTQVLNQINTRFLADFNISQTFNTITEDLLAFSCMILQMLLRSPLVQGLIITIVTSNTFCFLIPRSIKYEKSCENGPVNVVGSKYLTSLYSTLCDHNDTQAGSYSFEEDVLARIASITDTWASSIAGSDSSVALPTTLEKASSALQRFYRHIEASNIDSTDDLHRALMTFQIRLRNAIWAIHDFNSARHAAFARVRRELRTFNRDLTKLATAYTKRPTWKKVWDWLVSDTSSDDLVHSISQEAIKTLDYIADHIDWRVLKPGNALIIELGSLRDLLGEIADDCDEVSKSVALSLTQMKTSQSQWRRLWLPQPAQPTEGLEGLDIQHGILDSFATPYQLTENNLNQATSIYKAVFVDVYSLAEELRHNRKSAALDIAIVSDKIAMISDALKRLDAVQDEESEKRDEVITRLREKGETFMSISVKLT